MSPRNSVLPHPIFVSFRICGDLTCRSWVAFRPAHGLAGSDSPETDPAALLLVRIRSLLRLRSTRYSTVSFTSDNAEAFRYNQMNWPGRKTLAAQNTQDSATCTASSALFLFWCVLRFALIRTHWVMSGPTGPSHGTRSLFIFQKDCFHLKARKRQYNAWPKCCQNQKEPSLDFYESVELCNIIP